MNAPLHTVVLSLSILGLAACAASPPRSAHVEPERVLRPGEARVEQDDAYIEYVNRVARRRGIQVQWVNPPTRRVTGQ